VSACPHGHGPPHLTVESAGMVTVQDLGRPGHGHQGISENGAGDRWSAQVANTVVGNPPGAPLLEVTSSSLSVRVDADVLVCVTGAGTEPHVSGRPAPSWDPFVLRAGDLLVLPAPQRGLRTYVAVAGGLTARTVLGSVAPDRMLGAGTYLGRGDELELASCLCGWRHPHFGQPLFRLGAVRPSWSPRSVLDVTGGPELGEYDGRELVGPWTVSAQSDAVGLRAEGPTPTRSTSREILSRGVPVGAVEVPPGGGLLILLHGRLITAGYPVPYVATTAGIDRLGQARPGDVLLLREVPLAEAVAQGHARRLQLTQLAQRVATALGSSGLGAHVRAGHLSERA
jgi:biotin-dependent carboxylase-like uncharacterized protein